MSTDPGADAAPTTEPQYRLSVGFDADIFKVRVSGEVDAQAVRIAYWRDIIDTAHAHGYRKLLVIDRKKGSPARPEELAELARIFSAQSALFDRVAVVEPTPAFLPAIEHAEIHGQSAGINVRIFAHEVDAERWLHFGSADA
jgi:hypothetical protein